jgi:hypothetical protein
MRGVLVTRSAELTRFKAFLLQLLILKRRIIPVLANRTF